MANWSGPEFSYKLLSIVGFGLVEMAISTNPKSTISSVLYFVVIEHCGVGQFVCHCPAVETIIKPHNWPNVGPPSVTLAEHLTTSCQFRKKTIYIECDACILHCLVFIRKLIK